VTLIVLHRTLEGLYHNPASPLLWLIEEHCGQSSMTKGPGSALPEEFADGIGRIIPAGRPSSGQK